MAQPTRGLKAANLEFAPISHVLMSKVTWDGARRVEDWCWTVVKTSDSATNVLTLAAHWWMMRALQGEHGEGVYSPPVAHGIGYLLCALSVCRLRRAMSGRQAPRWAARALRLLPSDWLARATSDAGLESFRAEANGGGPAELPAK